MAHLPAFRWTGIFALFCMVGLLAFCAYARDLGHVVDQDLSVVSVRIPAERNTLTSLLEAASNLHYPDDYIEAANRIDLAISGAAWDSGWVASLLVRNATSLTQFGRARKHDAFQVRIRSVQGEQEALGNWLMLAKLDALDARNQSLHGDPEGALDAMLDLAQFGVRLRELDGGRMVHYLVGTSVIRISMEALARMLKDAAFDSSRASAVVRSLEALRLDQEGWSQVMRGDYQWSKGLLDESVEARGGGASRMSQDPFARDVLDSMVSLAPLDYSLQRNRTLQRLAGHYRLSMLQVPQTCRSLSHREQGLGRLPQSPSAYSFERNALGNYWADLARASIQIYQQTSCVMESHLSAVQVMVALRSFEAEHRRMPESLDALVPVYFDRVPIDYFDGNPIRYSPNDHLIYSVGSDLVDAQGQWQPGEPCNSELSFPIPFETEGHALALSTRITCAGWRS